MEFQLVSPFQPAGDQPQAIAALPGRDPRRPPLAGVDGRDGLGKTFTMANVIQAIQRPTLVLSHNKTLAAQLYSEFKEFFPHNAVNYFVSYYDYYQPEAYIPQRDIYIEKDASINEEIDRLRLAATSALVSRRDVIIVASVSCIYGLGSPDDYRAMMVGLHRGSRSTATKCSASWSMYNTSGTTSSSRGPNSELPRRLRRSSAVVRRDAFRIEFWGTKSKQAFVINPVSGETIDRQEQLFIHPAKHFVLPEERVAAAIDTIKQELDERLTVLRNQNKLLEAQPTAGTRFDIEMMAEMVIALGSKTTAARSAAACRSRPYTLDSFFPKDYMLFVDESHATVPQVRGMFNGDHNRKAHARRARLPGCPAPSTTGRSNSRNGKKGSIRAVFVSATPGPYETREKPAANSSSR